MNKRVGQNIRGISFGAVIICCISNVLARELTLDDLVITTLQASPAVRASMAAVDGGKKARNIAKWARYLNVTLLTQNRIGGSSNRPNSEEELATTAKVELNLWSSGRVSAEIDAAETRKTSLDWAMEETREQIALRTISAWRSMLSAYESVQSDDRAMDRMIDFEAKIQRRINAGLAPLVDLDTVNARKLQIYTERQAAVSQMRNAVNRLNLQAGATLNSNLPHDMLSVEQQVIKATFLGDLPDTQQVVNLARNSPTYLRALSDARVANLEIDAARARRFPELIASYEYRPGALKSPDTQSFYLTLSYQSGSGLTTWSQIKAVQSRYESLLNAADNALLEASDILISDVQEYLDASQRIKLTEQALQKSKEIVDSNLRLFDAGKRSVFEILNAFRELAQNEKALAPLKAQLIATHYILGIRMGVHMWQLPKTAL